MDDEDEFLYGSPKRQKLDRPADDDYEPSGGEAAADAAVTGGGAAGGAAAADGGAGESEDESDEESDIEFIINPSPGTKVEPPTRAGPFAGVRAGGADGAASGAGSGSGTPAPAAARGPGIDIEKIPVYPPQAGGAPTTGPGAGKPLTQLDLETLENKPWRLPGADVTDYFNFGFDEFTWSAYCAKQDRLRTDFEPGKVLAQMMMSMNGGPQPGAGMTPEMMEAFNSGSGGSGGDMDMYAAAAAAAMMGGQGQSMFPFNGMMPGMPGMPGMGMAMPEEAAAPAREGGRDRNRDQHGAHADGHGAMYPEMGWNMPMGQQGFMGGNNYGSYGGNEGGGRSEGRSGRSRSRRNR
ncbi:Fip1 motif-domain-containing protein [Dipodascopsis tothii]|uniref:Fip1 motif-domain-containing protein n=1 Tax=Dipodascopsis tothii TaxID=44089 RepID=UPI0034CDF991